MNREYMDSLVDSSLLLTNVSRQVKVGKRLCEECGSNEDVCEWQHISDYQPAGLSANVIDVYDGIGGELRVQFDGDADSITIEQSDDLHFCDVKDAQTFSEPSTFIASSRYVRAKLNSGNRTMVWLEGVE